MTISDFSSNFDTLLNSYAIKAGFGDTNNPSTIELDEYEKSVVLTKAQQEIVTELYNGRNPLRESFEETELLRRYLATLVMGRELEPITNSSGKPLGIDGGNSYFFSLNKPGKETSDVMFITYESVTLSDNAENGCKASGILEVVPVKQDEYHRIKQNPFRGANDRRALRLDLSDDIVEIKCKYIVSKYYIRYIRKIKPIILVDLGEEQSIEGETQVMGCELPEILHQNILDRAIMIALQSRGYTNSNNK